MSTAQRETRPTQKGKIITHPHPQPAHSPRTASALGRDLGVRRVLPPSAASSPPRRREAPLSVRRRREAKRGVGVSDPPALLSAPPPFAIAGVSAAALSAKTRRRVVMVSGTPLARERRGGRERAQPALATRIACEKYRAQKLPAATAKGGVDTMHGRDDSSPSVLRCDLDHWLW